jgi:hypothetical protein
MKRTAFDVSLVLASHRERTLLRRTLLSLREAAHRARAEGITVELVATLDRADELTRQVLREFETDGSDGWTVVEGDHGSPDPSRNYAFGYRHHCWKFFPLDTVTPLAFLEQHPYTSGAFEGLNNKIRVIQRRAYGLRDEDYLRLKILTCMLPML